jgi:glucose/arabinose dehydrogenase
MKKGFVILVLALISCRQIPEFESTDVSYRVENIRLPDGLTGETGAIEFLPDGRLVACFLRGEVMIYDPKKEDWKFFASGLHEPLGLLVLSEKEMLVMQRPELTRLVDTDEDGKADLFETVNDAFGMTGNYHEWNYGPVRDTAGNLYIGLNTASEYGIVMPEVRGKLDTTLVPGKPLQKFAAVPYRGWIMQLKPDGSIHPFAGGFRSPNGLVMDDLNRLFATDNQGDWVGTSVLYQVKEGNFYGHPASLLWKEGWDRGDPSKIPVKELEAMKTPGSVLFPHGIMAASPTQPVIDRTSGKFGPFTGQFFIGEMNQERILRVMLEEIDGQLQGACIPFVDGQGLLKGSNRLAFAPDGSLWVGHAQHGFAGDLGIQRIVYTGRAPMEVHTMHLQKDGFELTLTQPVHDTVSLDKALFRLRHYYYEYHLKYGSDQYDVQAVPVSRVDISSDRKKLVLVLPDIKAGYIYELTLPSLVSDTGKGLENKLICYTVNRLFK